MEYRFVSADDEVPVKIDPAGEAFRVEVGGREHRVRVLRSATGVLDLEVDGRRCRVHLAAEGAIRHLSLEGIAYRLEKGEAGPRRRTLHRADHGLEARMPGLVRSVPAVEGARVERGETLVVLEAMKMEIRVTAPEAAVVSRVLCREGQQVERGQLLVELAPE